MVWQIDKSWMKRFLKFSSFKAGLVLTLVFAVFYWQFIPHDSGLQKIVTSLDYRIADEMFRIRGEIPISDAVVIVDIDERSLAQLGQWPWPRTEIATLLRKISIDEPKVIGMDIVFAEPDRTSPSKFIKLFEDLAGISFDINPEEYDNDRKLGEVLYETPTIVAYFFVMEEEFRKQAVAAGTTVVPPCPEFSLPLSALNVPEMWKRQFKRGQWPIVSLPEIAGNALSEGFFNTEPDASGILRQAPLLINYKDVLYPSLAFEMLREGTMAEPKLAYANTGLTGIMLGEQLIPTDQKAQVWINFRGPEKTFPYISVVDILQDRVPKGTFHDKYVLVGTSSWGLRDLRTTPFSPTCPGVELHATVIDNVLAGDPLRHDIFTERGVNLLLVVVGGIGLTALLAYSGPLLGGMAGLIMLLLITVGNYFLFFIGQNKLVGLTYSLVALIAVFLVVTLMNFFLEGRAKRFVSGAFSRYVSSDVVAELIRNPEKLTLEGEEKNLSVLFSDIRGFTSISEQLGAREMSAFLNEYLTVMTDIIMENKGTVDKFIGDAIMAIWNAPLDDEEHAIHAVRAGLKMHAALLELADDWSRRKLPQIKIGVGINTGIMNVGNMGSKSRFDYTVIGDNVNLAARLESLTKEYGVKILITEATKMELQGRFLCRLVDVVRVKGKNEPAKMYEPLVEGEGTVALREEVAKFERALAAYRQQKFDQAREIIAELQQLSQNPLYDLYMARIEGYLCDPPAKDWDGVFVFTHK